jgi:hypothetical protein
MKFKVFIVLLVLLTWSLNSKAQVKLPITGKFQIEALDKNEKRDFDKIIITNNGYTLCKGEKSLRTYKLISKNTEGYLMEQVFEGTKKKDTPRFTVSLDKEENDVCYITVFRGSKVEKLKLTKIKKRQNQ